jgi:RNA methyltransferase, TrmH family
MTQIASPHNPRLKAVRRLRGKRERARRGCFVVEGEDLIAAAGQAGARALEGYRLAGSELGEDSFLDVERSALASVSTLGSGTRVIGVYEQRWGAAVGPLCVYLHGVADPGNVGTVLRSARAFGASCVALGPGCADPYSPKAVRASMGAIFAVALARVQDVGELPGERIALLAGERSVGDGPVEIGPLRWPISDRSAGEGAQLTLLIGAERDGLPAEVVAACERAAWIPIASDSLNAAMAATVALYEMTRGGGRGIDTVPTS